MLTSSTNTRLRNQNQRDKHALLLDFDGVILRHCKLHSAVYSRCQKFVHMHIDSIRNPVKIAELNKSLYESSGHTVIGLQKLGYDVKVHEFNQFVYDHINYTSLADFASSNKNLVHDMLALKDFCDNSGVSLGIFSNAPNQWCKTILHYIDPDLETIPTLSYITDNYLKPSDACYKHAQRAFRSYKHVTFVDDKMINLVSPRISSWTKVWVSESPQDEIITLPQSNMFIIGNGDSVIRHIHDIIKQEALSKSCKAI